MLRHEVAIIFLRLKGLSIVELGDMLGLGEVITTSFFWTLFPWKILTSLPEGQALMSIPGLIQELSKATLDHLC